MIDFLEKPKAPWALRPVPPFPAVAQRVLTLVGREDVHIQQIGDVIKTDPSFSAELLRFANSALFGVRGKGITSRMLPMPVTLLPQGLPKGTLNHWSSRGASGSPRRNSDE